MNPLVLTLFIWLLQDASAAMTMNHTASSVASSDETRYRISEIQVEGNEQTRERYILMELTFAPGDSVTVEELEEAIRQSHNNLVNTSLFLNHKISITWKNTAENDIRVLVSLKERWYFWPEPVLQNAERNFNTWIEERDFRKLNYGVDLIKDNFRGRNERLAIVLRFGYDEKYEITYIDPYFNKSKTLGFGVGAGFTGNHEVAFRVKDDRLEFFRAEEYIMTRKYAFTQMNFRPSFNHFHTFRLMYLRFQVDDTLKVLNPGFSMDAGSGFSICAFRYFLKIDHRDFKAYPLNGYYFDIEYEQYGLNFLKTATNTVGSLKANIRGYWQLSGRAYYGAGTTLRATTAGATPFLFEQGLGYGREFVRGYEYNVIHGDHFILLKQNLKYALIPSKDIDLEFMPHRKFRDAWFALYINLFTDAGYVSGEQVFGNKLVNKWIGGAGIGLDLVTYYDKVFRIEAALNDIGKGGIYLHFIAPI